MSPARRGPPRAVLDTSVVVSALVFGGGPAGRLRQAWQQEPLLPLVSTATVQELMRVLAYPKFRLGTGEREELLADYLPWTEVVEVPHPPPRVPECHDVHDLPFLRLAAAGRADALVTGDDDLLALAAADVDHAASPGRGRGRQARLPCPVLTLSAFLLQIEPQAIG